MINSNSNKTKEILILLKGLSRKECISILSNAKFILKDYFKSTDFNVDEDEILELIEKEKYNPIAR